MFTINLSSLTEMKLGSTYDRFSWMSTSLEGIFLVVLQSLIIACQVSAPVCCKIIVVHHLIVWNANRSASTLLWSVRRTTAYESLFPWTQIFIILHFGRSKLLTGIFPVGVTMWSCYHVHFVVYVHVSMKELNTLYYHPVSEISWDFASRLSVRVGLHCQSWPSQA